MIPCMADTNGCLLLFQIRQISVSLHFSLCCQRKGPQTICFGNRWGTKTTSSANRLKRNHLIRQSAEADTPRLSAIRQICGFQPLARPVLIAHDHAWASARPRVRASARPHVHASTRPSVHASTRPHVHASTHPKSRAKQHVWRCQIAKSIR